MTISDGYLLATDAQFRELSNFATPPRAGKITAIEASGQVRVETDDPDGGDVLAWPLSGFTYAVDDVVYVAFAVNYPDSALVIGSKGPELPELAVLGITASQGSPATSVVELGGTSGTTGSLGRFYRNLTAGSTDDAVVSIIQDHASDDQYGLYVRNDGTARAVYIEGPGGLEVNRTTSSTTLLRGVFTLKIASSGSASNGFGPSFNFIMNDAETGDDGANIIGQIGAVRSGADNSGDVVIQNMNAGSTAETLRVTKEGRLEITQIIRAKSSSGLDLQDDAGNSVLKVIDGGYLNYALTKRTTAQFDKTNNTLANITGLSVALPASGSWRFVARLFVRTAAVAGVGAKVGVAYSGTTSTFRAFGQQLDTGALSAGLGYITSPGQINVSAGGGAGTDEFYEIEGYLVATGAGNLTIQFAQNTTNATASSVLTGSTLEVWQLT